MSNRQVTLAEKPFSALLGTPVAIGQQAPAAAGRINGFSTETFDVINDTQGKIRVLNFIPSLNTGLCDTQTRRFNEELLKNDNVAVVTISVDLPWIQENWCGAAGLDDAIMVSDYYDMAIANAYGTHIEAVRLEQRAVIIVDAEGVVRYTEYCPEVAVLPDFDAALSAVAALL